MKIEQQRANFEAWIRHAYREPESVTYTIYNMEVAYQAGCASAEADRKRRGEPQVPEGFRLIAVNETFDSLMYWLDRCEQKGHLENCADLVEPWEEFEYREVETTQPAEPEDDKLKLDRLADYVADNWPDKKYTLEEIAQRLHATWPGAFMPAEPVKILGRNPTTVIMDGVNPVKVPTKAQIDDAMCKVSMPFFPDETRDGTDWIIQQFVKELWKIAAPQPPQIPEGYKIVPIEPTPEMMRAGCQVPLNKAARHNLVYKAMLEAAPEDQ